MSDGAATVVTGNASEVSRATRGWFVGHFMPGDENPLRSEALELKWFTHAKGETRSEWAPANAVRTLNLLVQGRFVLRFPEREVTLAREGDFVLFGPGVPHSFRSEEESLVLTIRWPSLPG
jgi:mannose-6-phosphate isomerase-like protein (cupin superfamily)